MPFQIAIDGPVAAGKGTVAKLVASRLGFLYVDTGAMYRATALLAKKFQADWNSEAALVDLLGKHELRLRTPTAAEQDGRNMTVILDDEDVSWAIRTEEMGKGASIVSQFPGVRQELVKQQQRIAASADVVMEGRDITFRVLPQAQLKIYMDASPETRAERRFQELLIRGKDTTYEAVFNELRDRDQRDMQRTVDPLHVVSDAWKLDTTQLTIPEVVEVIAQRAKELQATQSATADHS